MRRLLVISTLVLVLAALLAGCSAPTAAPVNPPTTAVTPTATPTPSAGNNSAHVIVNITDTAFVPSTVTIKAGSQVVWQNTSLTPESIVLNDGSLTSPTMSPGDVARHVFSKAGTFGYHSLQHPTVGGTVIVQ
ncbi:MAG: cupredoxin domain-containing protein [Coriobacteriia bacterium]|nr:cupredoxin domain-containing protein [Coriobacteriia bacterium]